MLAEYYRLNRRIIRNWLIGLLLFHLLLAAIGVISTDHDFASAISVTTPYILLLLFLVVCVFFDSFRKFRKKGRFYTSPLFSSLLAHGFTTTTTGGDPMLLFIEPSLFGMVDGYPTRIDRTSNSITIQISIQSRKYSEKELVQVLAGKGLSFDFIYAQKKLRANQVGNETELLAMLHDFTSYFKTHEIMPGKI